MNWVYLPTMKRWVNLDYMISIETTPEPEGKFSGRHETNVSDGTTCYTFPEDAEVVFKRLSELQQTSE